MDHEQESPSQTIVTGPNDDPIIDEYGVAYRLGRGDRIFADGTVAQGSPVAIELAYVSRVVWALDPAHRWWPRKDDGTWGPPVPDSPLVSDKLDQILQKLTSLALAVSVLNAAVSDLEGDVDVLLQRTQGKIELDLQNATFTRQPVPQKRGP